MNILEAIINMVNSPVFKLKDFYSSKNRANSMGDALEEYVKDIFADIIREDDDNIRDEKFSRVFSYLGNQNNPPDIILRNSDAIEVKKIESKNSGLALNSSYPKSKLFSNSSMITKACRECEAWDVKDIIYAVGVVNANVLKSLCLVYGIDYAADAEVYERIKTAISTGILSIPDIEFSETRELGRVNKVDPLGITYLRVRGMWHIQNPIKTFNYIYTEKADVDFNFMALINIDKYMSFPEDIRKTFESKINSIPNLEIKNVKIRTPNNPSILRSAKLVTYYKYSEGVI